MRKLLKTVLATVVFMITAVHTGAMAAEGTIILRMYGKAIEEIKNAPKDRHYVFTPVRYSWDASILALNRPQNSIMDPNEWSMLVVSDYYRKKRDIIAVPEELRNFRADMGCPIAGEPDMRLWNGHLVYLNPTDTLFDAAYTRYERGGKAEFAHLKRVVFPGADGENYIYIIPHRSVANIFAGDPVEINLIHYSKNK